MPRIDPARLLKTLGVLLAPDGGIKSTEEVPRLVQLMQKFSKKLVSKVVYVKILRSSSSELLECFLNEKGWELLNTWFSEAIRTSNWPLCTELLQLFALCPISAHRLKENADQNQAPKLVRQLSLDARVDSGVRNLSNQLFNSWMSIVSQQQSQPVRSARLTRSLIVPNPGVQTQLVSGQPRVLVAVHTSTEEIINMTNMTVASGMMNQGMTTTINAVRPNTNTHIMSADPFDVMVPGASLQFNQQNHSSQNGVFGVIRNECLEDAMDIDDLVDRTLSNNVTQVVSNEVAGVSILQGMADELSETLKKEVQDDVKEGKLLKKKEELRAKEKLKEKSRDRSSKSDKEKSKDKSRDSDRDKRHSDDSKRRREKERQKEKEKKEKKRESKPFRETEVRGGVDTAEKQRIKELAEKMRQEVKALPKIPKVPKKEEAPKDVASNISTNKPSFDDLMSAMENPSTKTVKSAPIKNKNRDLLASLSDTTSKPKPKSKEVKKISRTDFLLKDRGPTEDKSKAIIKEKEPEKKEEPKVESKKDEEKKSVKRPAPEEESKLKVKSPSQLVDSPMFGDFLSTIIPEVPKKKKIKFSDLKAQKESKVESSKEEDSSKSSENEDKMIKPTAFSFYGEGNVSSEENNSEEKPDSPEHDSSEIVDSETLQEEKPFAEEYTGPREVRGILVINKGAKQTRRIQWRPMDHLVEVEYFEVEEGERVNVNKLKFEEQRKKELEFEKMRMKNKNDNFEMDDRPWPELTSVQLSCEMPEIEYGGNSKEKKEQQLRETSTLQALFFNKNPTDPLEPDSGLASRMECKEIPLEDASGEEEAINDYTADGWPEPIYDSFMSSPPRQPQAPAPAGMLPTANNILQNLIGGGQLLGGNQQAMDDALFAAQKAAAETLLKQGLLPPVFMDQNVPPGQDNHDNMMEYDDMPPNINQPPPGMGWRGGPAGPQHHHRQGPPMQGPPPFRRGGNGPMNRMNNIGGHHNDFNRGGGFGGRGMPQRGHFPLRGGFQNRPPHFNDRPNFGNNHGNMNSGRGRRPCKYWMESGSCRQEDRCGFLHPGGPGHHR